MKSTNPLTMQNETLLHRQVQRIGWVVLIVGLVAATVIYLFAANQSKVNDDSAIVDQRLYNYSLERMGGKSMVYAVKLNDWLGSLWHGKPLAYTVAVLAVLTALLCFWLTSLLSTPLDQER